MRLGTYRHYKGQFYEVLRIVRHSETGEPMVLYRPLYRSEELSAKYGDDPWFVRPFDMFNEILDLDGNAVRRFEFVSAGRYRGE